MNQPTLKISLALTFILPLFLLGCGGLKSASSQNSATTTTSWFGTQQLGEVTYDSVGDSVTTDASQNVIIAGYTNGNFANCGGVSAACSGAAQGTYDMYISKYDRRGIWLWTRQLGETGHSIFPTQVLTDSSMNIYVAGYTDGNAVSCGGVSASCTGAAQGSNDMVLMKYDANGILQWTRQLGETSKGTFVGAFGLDSSNNLIVAGVTQGNLVSCGGVSANCTGSAQGTADFFIAKYNSSGTFISMYQLGETGKSIGGLTMAVDSSGDVYIGGQTSGNIPSCSGISASCTGSSQGTTDFFVSKYDPTLTWVWTKQLGETGKATAFDGIAVDAAGNVVVSGNTKGLLESCNGVSASCTGSATPTNGDIFVAKYDSTGAFQWLHQLDSPYGATYGYVATDSSNNIYVTGQTASYLVSCQGVSANCAGQSTGYQDLFLLKYDTSGTWLFTRQVGEVSKVQLSQAITVNSSGDPLIAASTSGSLVGANCNGLNPYCAGTSAGTEDSILLKYDSNGSIQ